MLFLTVDPHLGRVDYTSFSDQTLMEMLYAGFSADAIKRCQDTEGAFLDVCKWHSVKCDGDGNVVKFHDFYTFTGSLQLCYIPPKVETFRLQFKVFTGSIDLTQLPRSLWELDLGRDNLEGPIDLTRLPEGIKNLHLCNNRFSGSVELTQLPQSIKSLELQGNRFTGEIDLTRLPEDMESLYLHENLFTGSFIAKNLPHDLRINARENKFSSIALVESQATAEIFLCDSGATSVIDDNGNENSQSVCFFPEEAEFNYHDDY